MPSAQHVSYPAQTTAGMPRAWLRHTAVALLLVAACLGVFALYTQPEFLITLANMAWTCF